MSIAILIALVINALLILLVPGFREPVVESFRMVSIKEVPKSSPQMPQRQEHKVVRVRRNVQFSPTDASAPTHPPPRFEQPTEGPGLASADGVGEGYLKGDSSKPIPLRRVGMGILPDDFGLAAPENALTLPSAAAGTNLGIGRNAPTPDAPVFDITSEISSILPSGPVQPPAVIKSVPPVYPENARLAGVEGTVMVKVRLLYDGTIGEIRVVKSSGRADLDQAAIDCVKQWEFRPAMQSGIRVGLWVEVPVNFEITND